MGYSLGGVLLTHYLRVKGNSSLIDAGVSIAAPFHLPTSYKLLMSFSTSFLVNLYLCYCLVQCLAENRQVLESSVSSGAVVNETEWEADLIAEVVT